MLFRSGIAHIDITLCVNSNSPWTIESCAKRIAGTGVIWSFALPIAFLATTIGKTITTNGVVISTGLNNLYFDGDGGEWTLGSSFTKTGAGSFIFYRGSFITANYNVNIPALYSNTYSIRSFNWGSSTVTFSGVIGSIWNVTSSSNLTWNAGTSTFIFNTNAAQLTDAGGLGLTFYNFTINYYWYRLL